MIPTKLSGLIARISVLALIAHDRAQIRPACQANYADGAAGDGSLLTGGMAVAPVIAGTALRGRRAVRLSRCLFSFS